MSDARLLLVWQFMNALLASIGVAHALTLILEVIAVRIEHSLPTVAFAIVFGQRGIERNRRLEACPAARVETEHADAAESAVAVATSVDIVEVSIIWCWVRADRIRGGRIGCADVERVVAAAAPARVARRTFADGRIAVVRCVVSDAEDDLIGERGVETAKIERDVCG